MKTRISHLLWLTIAVAVLFAMSTWGPLGWAILWTLLFLVHITVFAMPIAIFVFAIGTSPIVNKQLDVKNNKTVAICFLTWLMCVAVMLAFWFIIIRFG